MKLRCITSIDGIRCRGQLCTVSETKNEFRCSKCGQSYPSYNGVPFVRTSIDQNLDNGLEHSVYSDKSRTRSLAGEDLYFEQSNIFWDYLPRFVEEHRIKGPCLEVGCGVGIFADRVPQYVGLDYALSALLAEGFESYDRVCASGDLLPFENEQFQLVFSLNTYEHVPDLQAAFEEIDRVLKPGGYAILKPAWNCQQFNCDGVGYFPYRELSFTNKLKKLLLPVLRSKIFKILTRIPKRFWASLFKIDSRLVYTRLRPRFDLLLKVADSEAFSSIDPFFAIRFFRQRGYEATSHRSYFSQLISGHEIVVVQKSNVAPTPRDC